MAVTVQMIEARAAGGHSLLGGHDALTCLAAEELQREGATQGSAS